ncbi:MAG: AarF/ABC1/UbiB kinase family protein, partial [Firmicutes bacterium]|nr:AarF/ABC1/UbiB kinase family protein [Bacillota bacterium]
MGKLAGTLPRRLNKILEKLAWNDLKVPVEHRIPDESARLLNRTVNRLILGILAGALFAGSAMLVTFGANGIDEMPSIRWLGEGMLWGSAVLSVYVIWRVIRSKRG